MKTNHDRRHPVAIGGAVTIYVLAFVIALFSQVQTQAQELTLEDVFAAQRRHMSRLHSLDMTYAAERKDVSPEMLADDFIYERIHVYHLQISGRQFRKEGGLKGSQWPEGRTGPESIYSYNSDEKWQNYVKHRGLFVVSRREYFDVSRELANTPILVPYRFLIQGDPWTHSIESVQSDGPWDDLIPLAEMAGQEERAGHVCLRVDLTAASGSGSVKQVFFATDLELYPIQVRRFNPSGRLVGERTVTDYQRIDTSDGAIIVPMEIRETHFGEGNRIDYVDVITVEADSLRINEDIPNEIFTITAAPIDVDAVSLYFYIGSSGDLVGAYEGEIHIIPWESLSREARELSRMAPAPPPEPTVRGDHLEFDLVDLEGNPVSLSDDRFRNKVVIVDIWGSWCGQCRLQIPYLVEFSERYQERGLEVVGIAFEHGDEGQGMRTLNAYLEGQDLPYTIAFGGSLDSDREVVEETFRGLTNFQGFPTTIYIGRSGAVRQIESGFGSWRAPKMESLIVELLAESP